MTDRGGAEMANVITRTKGLVRAVGISAIALFLAVLLPTWAHAEETTCTGTLGETTVDNLRVPDGANCTLDGTRVEGTVKVESDAVLKAKRVRVIGNVQGENADKVKVRDSRVGESVQVVQGEKAKVRGTVVTGDVLYDENQAALKAIDNTVGGDIQAFQNTGGVQISTNSVDGNLQCKENVPAPTGGGNVVQGNKEDQCAGL
jgi:hypothetical protein